MPHRRDDRAASDRKDSEDCLRSPGLTFAPGIDSYATSADLPKPSAYEGLSFTLQFAIRKRVVGSRSVDLTKPSAHEGVLFTIQVAIRKRVVGSRSVDLTKPSAHEGVLFTLQAAIRR
ncbi:hypothetical protein J6590_000202 [Homalodisca vitripennis]|nr:hypothetical protein J6590_000202 [Homalodisca vitripennis]